MVADQPLISYKKDKPEVSTKKEADELADKWAKRREEDAQNGVKVSLSEMFGGNDTKKQDIWQM